MGDGWGRSPFESSPSKSAEPLPGGRWGRSGRSRPDPDSTIRRRRLWASRLNSTSTPAARRFGAKRRIVTPRFVIGCWVLEPVPFALLFDHRFGLDDEPRQYPLCGLESALEDAIVDLDEPACSGS